MNSRLRWRSTDECMDLAGEQIDPSQQAERAMTFILMLTCEGRVNAGHRWQIWRGRCDGLNSRLLVVGDDRHRLILSGFFDLAAAFFRTWTLHRKKLTVDFEGGNQSSDGGLLLLRQAERELGVCRRLADAMPDRRDPDRIRHAMFEMVMERVSAIACGHEDAIDLDRLRHDPLMKVAVGRCPQTGAPLASQSTISRLENAPGKTEAARLCAALLDQFGTTVNPGRLGDPPLRRHLLRGPWRPAARVLERASRRARLCVDAHLLRGERHACARRSTSATSSPRSRVRRSIFTRTSTASAGRWRA